jgi:peptidoglycan hydrolase-like protein with peptidoglycan-binding domain
MKPITFKQQAAGGLLAMAMLTTALPAQRAEAATLEQLQAQIQVLLAQLEALKGGSSSNSNLATCNPFAIDLTLGRSGVEVTNLQKFLITQGHTIPAGATGYFGEQTRTALAQFQSKHGISPAAGYFGPMTRGKVNALCAATQTPGTDNNGGNTDTPTSPVTLNGEAAFDNYTVTEGDDTSLEEGQKNVSVMDVEFDVEDGDARVNRIDVGFTPDNANTEKRPWRVFTEIAIYDGSTLLKKIDATNRSSWKENNPTTGSYMIRLSGIDHVVTEDDTASLSVRVATASTIDGVADGEAWNIFIPTDGIRAMDAKNLSVSTGNTSDTVTLDIEKGGSSDELTLKRSSDDPEATTLKLKEDARSGFMTVFAFDLDTDNSASDIEIRKLPVQLTVSDGTVGTYLRDARIVIDGTTYTKKTIVDGATNTITFEFNRDQLVIDAGDRVTAEVQVEFKPLAPASEGTTIFGSVDSDAIDAEGGDDLEANQLIGLITGETHTMHTKGIIASPESMTSEVTSVTGVANDYGTFTIEMDITAFGQDVYIPTSVADAATYQLEDANGVVSADTGSAFLTSNAKKQGAYFFIPEGDTKTITLEVTYQPGVPMTKARLQMLSLAFSDTASAPTQTWDANPETSYETTVKTIVD